MAEYTASLTGRVALVTGGAQRIGAEICRTLHGAGMSIALHYRRAAEAAEQLRAELEGQRPESVLLLQADLLATDRLPRLVDKVIGRFGRLDALVNNASGFYPTPVGSTDEAQWDDLLGSNVKAPFFLAQAAAAHLKACKGSIVNLADVHGLRPLRGHAVYSIAKAANVMLTRALAAELGPEVRVNGIAPGAILWPQGANDDLARQRILARTALKRQGSPADVARAVLFLLRDADYVTGQVLPVDGGRTLDAF